MEKGWKSIRFVYSQSSKKCCGKRFSQVNIASSSCCKSGSNFCLRFLESTLQQSLFSSALIEIRYQASFFLCASPKKSNNYSNSDASESVYTAKCYANMTEAWNRNFIRDVNNTEGENALQLQEPRHYKPHQSKYTMCVLYWSYTNSFQGGSPTFPAPRRRKSSLALSLITFSYFAK